MKRTCKNCKRKKDCEILKGILEASRVKQFEKFVLEETLAQVAGKCSDFEAKEVEEK